MISLFVDTALSYIRIAIIKDNELLDFINEECRNNMSAVFDVKVRDIFCRNNLCLNDVDKIYAVTGPGSFTGIRVGLTFVKVLAWSLNKTVVPISELQVLASGSSFNRNVLSLIDARRGYVYGGVYDENLNMVVADSYINSNDIILNSGNVEYVSYDSFDGVIVSNPKIDFLKLIGANYYKAPVSCHVLVPNYLKLTEAEEKLKEAQSVDN